MDKRKIKFMDGQWAIVWSPEEGWQLITPNPKSRSEHVPQEALVLTGAFVQLDQDPQFRADCLKFFMEKGQ